MDTKNLMMVRCQLYKISPQSSDLLWDEFGLLQQLPVHLGGGVEGEAAVGVGAELAEHLAHILDQPQPQLDHADYLSRLGDCLTFLLTLMKNISKANQINKTAYFSTTFTYTDTELLSKSNKSCIVHVLVTSLTPDTGDPTSQASPSRAGTRCTVLMVGGHSSYKGHMS